MPLFHATRNPALSRREIDHMNLARRIAGECVVLLENDGILPLSGPGSLALYGSGARDTVRGGTGSGDVNTRSDVNIEQGLEQAGFSITTRAWLDRQQTAAAKARQDYLDWIPRCAAEKGISEFLVTCSFPFLPPAPVPITAEDIASSAADTAVYVISRNSGEGADRWNRRGDYLLYEEERDQLIRLGEAYERLIVVLNVGGVMDLSELKAIPGIRALLLMGQLGNIGGNALADVLLGSVSPSGHLTDTWAKSYQDYPSSPTFSHNDGDVDDEFYTEGIYTGYRYFDTFGVEPLYPFGYGLSYTTFAWELCSWSLEEHRQPLVRLAVRVTNTGTRPGQETLQVYTSAPEGTLPKPWQELKAFAKTRLLAPGEAETLELSFPAASMASWSEQAQAWILEPGEYQIRVGTHSRSTRVCLVLTLERAVTTAAGSSLFRDPQPVEEITALLRAAPSAPPDLPRIPLSPESFLPAEPVRKEGRESSSPTKAEMLTLEDVRQGRCSLEDLVAQLTVPELARLCVGNLRSEESSIVGSASCRVPGAAGETFSLPERSIPSLILADGPAGLRLQPEFRVNPQGEVVADAAGENCETLYQYCTAIPIAWSLAQSWNLSALEEIGAMIGREMEEFGVDLWLAPALNIHRNPLCGRNFEYMSEDPLISGRAAAAITRGVQSIPGKGVTLKHFAANSQEDNRYFTNSHISPRALREIYLKGFQIAVEESAPMAIMTSYNLLNGIHTANCRDLLQQLARGEWGFSGLIMTDWYTSQDVPAMTGITPHRYPISSSVGCIWAGNDLQMPGCQRNVDDIVRAVESAAETDGFRITLPDLQKCAGNILRVLCRCL